MSDVRVETTPTTPPGEHLLEVEDLAVSFFTDTGVVTAVDGVSFSLDAGRTLAIVGESGSGKTVSTQAMMGLIPKPPGKIMRGTAKFRGRDLLTISDEEMRKIRGREIAMIFQEPLTALNPVHRVGSQIVEMIRSHEEVSKKEARQRAIELLKTVGIPQPDKRVDNYPHEFSGGMRQRAMIAMALALNPAILIADEPTTALDVTVQAQILELLKGLQEEFGMGLIMITHDLGVVAQISDEILVMYAGRMVERGDPEDVFYKPQHPYTWGLLGSIPRVLEEELTDERLVNIPGMPPSLQRVPPGCPFHPRCTFRFEPCDTERPELLQRGHHEDACFLEQDEKEAGRADILHLGTKPTPKPKSKPPSVARKAGTRS
ncbi:MAG TPA: ABC transporter ATP-binding protein [Actinomycetota bacterium]|nr:ABC transporter ATP-binding protein [Actinomycetota bacterium]